MFVEAEEILRKKQQRSANIFYKALNMVPETGLEPVQEVIPRDFKSLASTNSATPAEKVDENGGTFRIRTGDGDFADLCLTSWLRCQPKNFD